MDITMMILLLLIVTGYIKLWYLYPLQTQKKPNIRDVINLYMDEGYMIELFKFHWGKGKKYLTVNIASSVLYLLLILLIVLSV